MRNLRRFITRFRDPRAAIDLASIMVGVLLVAIIGGVIAASVFLAVPWTQDEAAKSGLSAVDTAESSAMVVYGGFWAYDSHGDSAFRAFEAADPGITRPDNRLIIETNDIGTTWLAAQRSGTGNVFFRGYGIPTIVEAADAGSITLPDGIPGTAVADMIAAIAGNTSYDFNEGVRTGLRGEGAGAGIPSAAPAPAGAVVDPDDIWGYRGGQMGISINNISAIADSATFLPAFQADGYDGGTVTDVRAWISGVEVPVGQTGWAIYGGGGSVTIEGDRFTMGNNLNNTFRAFYDDGTLSFRVNGSEPNVIAIHTLETVDQNTDSSLEYNWPEIAEFRSIKDDDYWDNGDGNYGATLRFAFQGTGGFSADAVSSLPSLTTRVYDPVNDPFPEWTCVDDLVIVYANLTNVSAPELDTDPGDCYNRFRYPEGQDDWGWMIDADHPHPSYAQEFRGYMELQFIAPIMGSFDDVDLEGAVASFTIDGVLHKIQITESIPQFPDLWFW